MNMVKVIDKKSVKTEFNFYHKYIIWKTIRRALLRFNKQYKLNVQEGKDYVSVWTIKIHSSYDGLKKRAHEEGIAQAKEIISRKYPVTIKPRGLCGPVEVFDISRKEDD